MLSRLSVQCCVRGDMDAISADALSARGVVLNQKSHVARRRQLAEPRIQGRIGLAPALSSTQATSVAFKASVKDRSIAAEGLAGSTR